MVEESENFVEAGKITARIREDSKKLIVIGESLLDIAETIEQMIYDEKVKPAFPVNLSLNDIAAHFTPEIDCKIELKENDVIKVDIGVEIDGGLGDTAYTIDLGGQHEKLVKAAEEGLATAINSIKPGVSVGEVGGAVEEKIKSYGYKPISNLTGHMMKSNSLHAGVSLPSVRSSDSYKFQVGDIFAVEPFATTGEGYVYDSDQVEIFSLLGARPVRLRQSRQILQHVTENYKEQPFAERWIRKKFPSKMLVSAGLKELLAMQALKGYPVLKEKGKGIVTQAEHTVLVEEKGARVLTK